MSSLRRFSSYTGLLTALLLVVLGIVMYAMMSASAAPAAPASPAADYGGPYTTMRVPTACAVPQTDLRYYRDPAPPGTGYLRSGAHGHGGHLRCIFFSTDNSSYPAGDHPYGKWLVFNEDGVGLLIGPDGIDVTYVNCALPGYHFPYPAGNGQPNDCGESWTSAESVPYLYQEPPDVGQTMFPAVLP